MPPGQKRNRLPHLLTVLVLCAFAAGCGRKEPTLYSPPANINPTHPPAVRIIVPADGATFRAHADIRLLALATPYGSNLGTGEEVPKLYADLNAWELVPALGHNYSVEFLAGTNSFSVQSTSMVLARVRVKRGQAQPMIMGQVGFPAVEWIWHDVPAGNHTLTAKVTNDGSLTTVSTSVIITVLP